MVPNMSSKVIALMNTGEVLKTAVHGHNGMILLKFPFTYDFQHTVATNGSADAFHAPSARLVHFGTKPVEAHDFGHGRDRLHEVLQLNRGDPALALHAQDGAQKQ